MVELFAMEYLTALGMTMVLLFLDSRYSRRSTILIVYGTALLVMAAVASIYCIAGLKTTLHIYTLIAHLPSLLLLLLLSRFRRWQLVFQLFSAILFCTLIQQGAGLMYYLSGHRVWTLVLAYVVLTAGVIWFLISFLRPLFLQTLLELRRGWWFMCLVMATYYIIVIYLIPNPVGSEKSSTILKPAISLLMVGFYSVVLFLFTIIRKEAEARHSTHLSTLQLSALQSRMEAVRTAEDAIRTERHDLRHRLQTAMELVARGDETAALDFLDAAQRRLDEQKEIRWCRPPVLDAVFSTYFAQAKSQNISIGPFFIVCRGNGHGRCNAIANQLHICIQRLKCFIFWGHQLMGSLAEIFLGGIQTAFQGTIDFPMDNIVVNIPQSIQINKSRHNNPVAHIFCMIHRAFVVFSHI